MTTPGKGPITQGVAAERKRAEPYTVTRYTPAKGHNFIRNPLRSLRKQIEAQMLRQEGGPLTKAQKARAKALAVAHLQRPKGTQ